MPQTLFPSRLFRSRRAITLALALGLGAMLPGCEQKYAQDTPEATIAAARAMIENGDARKLPNLVYAANPDERRLLNTVGRLTGNLETLAKEIATRFPQETAALKERAKQAAAEGKSTSIFAQLASQVRPQAGGRRRGRGGGGSGAVPSPTGGPPPREERQAFDDAITRLFVDPYAFLDDSQGKLSTQYMTDDQVALLWEGKMVLPPLGMLMRKGEDGKWSFVLPTSAPVLAPFMPKTPEQYKLMGGMVSVLDKVVVDLTKEVQAGQMTSLDAVSRRAGEMTFMPAVLMFYAYGKLRDEQAKAGSAPAISTPATPTPTPAPKTGG